MKTIAQFAKEKGVTTTTIYRKIDKAVKQVSTGVELDVEQGSTDVQQGVERKLTEKVDSVTYITEYGEQVLSSMLPPVQQSSTHVQHDSTDVQQSSTGVQQPDKSVKTHENEEILFLRKQVESLQAELTTEREHSREMSRRNAEINERFAKITENQQILLGVEQVKTSPAVLMGESSAAADAATDKKRGFFSRFKKK
jgi:hypothetical protein